MKQRQLSFIPSIEAKANGCSLFFVAPIALTSLIAAFALWLERMTFATDKDK